MHATVPARRAGLAAVMAALMAAALLASLALAPAAARAADAPRNFPDIVDATAKARGADRYDFAVTVSSPYDTPQRYADAFRVMGHDGRVFGVRELAHDHAGEQPFTRELNDVAIPPGLGVVIVQGRDKANGWGGRRLEVVLPGR